MRVRRFEERDRVSLRQIYLDARSSTFEWLDPESLRLSDFDRDTAGETIWVADKDGSVMGFVSVQERENFVHHLFVRPSLVGLGYGSKLLAKCLASMGTPARLKCIAENTGALSFYQAKGWRKVSEGVSEDGEYYVLETVKY